MNVLKALKDLAELEANAWASIYTAHLTLHWQRTSPLLPHLSEEAPSEYGVQHASGRLLRYADTAGLAARALAMPLLIDSSQQPFAEQAAGSLDLTLEHLEGNWRLQLAAQTAGGTLWQLTLAEALEVKNTLVLSGELVYPRRLRALGGWQLVAVLGVSGPHLPRMYSCDGGRSERSSGGVM